MFRLRSTVLIVCCAIAICPQPQTLALEVEALNYPAWLVRNYETRPLLPGTRIEENDLIRTGDGGRVTLGLDDGASFGIGSKSRLLVETHGLDDSANGNPSPTRLQILRGVFRLTPEAASAAPGSAVEIKIGSITANAPKAEFWGRSDLDQDLACLISGRVDIVDGGQERSLQQPLTCYVKPRDRAALPVDQVNMQQHRLWLDESSVDAAAGIAAVDGEWQLVLISLTDVDSADRELWRLRELGYAVNKKSVIREGRTLHRLLLPGFVSIDAALAAGAHFEEKLGIRGAWVWRAN